MTAEIDGGEPHLLRALGTRLLADRFLQAAVLAFALVVLNLFTVPEGVRQGSRVALLFVLLVVTAGAALHGRHRLASKERRFWGRLGAAFLGLGGAPLVFAGRHLLSPLVQELVLNLAFSVYYLFFALALEVRPHRLTKEPRSRIEQALGWPLLPVLVIGFLTYLVLIPIAVDLQGFRTSRPYLLDYVLLQIYIVFRLLWLRHRARPGIWRGTYGFLILSQGVLGGAVALELVHTVTGWPVATAVSDLLLALMFVLVTAAARLRHVPMSPARELYLTTSLAETVTLSTRTTAAALVVPVLHALIYSFGPEDASHPARQVFALVWLAVLGVLAAVQRDRFERPPRPKDSPRLESAHGADDLRLLVDRVQYEQPNVARGGKLAQVFLACPDPIAIQGLGDGMFLEVNPAWSRQMSFERRELVGRPETDVGLWVDDKQRRTLRRRLEAGETVHDEEVTWRDGNGAELRVLLSSAPVRLRGSRCSVDLVRLPQEEDVRRTQLFDDARAAVLILDLQGRITYWNTQAEQHSGWTAEEAVGQFASDLLGVAPDAWGDLAPDGGGELTRKLALRTRDGRMLSFESWSTALCNAAGQPRSRLVFAVPVAGS